MSSFSQAINSVLNSSCTANGALSYSTPDKTKEYEGRLSLFFKGARGLSTDKLRLHMAKSCMESLVDTFILAFHLRDCRGGKGERRLGRLALVYLSLDFPEEFRKVLPLLSEYGRWDDLLLFFPGVYENEAKSLDLGFRDTGISKAVLRMFSEQLETDRKNMLEGKPISLCAKWTPTENDSMDRKFSTYKSLYTHMNIKPRQLRKKYLSPLREYLKIVERLLSSKKIQEISYSSVPSQAMKKLKKVFSSKDTDRFNEWLESVKKGEKKINAKQLHPNEIIRELLHNNHDDVMEEQWKVLVEETRKIGTLRDALCVVDVSGSMESPNAIPISASIALGLIISEIVEGPFHNHVLTFHERPSFAVIEGNSLKERFQKIKNMQWGGSTDLQAVFHLIFNAAKQHNLKPEEMPKKLFIFSDMQFNSAVNSYRQEVTNMDAIDEMYTLAGYTRPHIIFWNLNGSYDDFPADTGYKNVSLISGFSTSMLSCLLKGEDVTPVSTLRECLDSNRYKKIREILG